MRQKVQIFIDHDIIIRHFINSGILRDLERNFEVQYVFPEDDKRISVNIDNLGLPALRKINVDRVRLARLRELAKIGVMSRIRWNREYSYIGNLYRDFIFDRATYRRMWVRSLPGVFSLYKRKVLGEVGVATQIKAAILDFQPDLVLHPSVLEGLFISDLTMICRDLKIPLLAVMNSWDNPSSKASCVGSPTKLGVWGPQTKKHAIEFLGLKDDQIEILGAAQFDVYRQPARISRKEFCDRLNIDPNLKIILYAGSSKAVNEIEHLKLLEDAVISGTIPDSTIVYRPHPWRSPAEGEPDFFDVTWKKVVMDSTMSNSYNSPKSANPDKMNLTSYEDTHDVLSAVDIVASNISTIMLEAALHGKPVLCMLTKETLEKHSMLRVFADAIYFKEMIEKLNIEVCHKDSELPALCGKLLKDAESPDFKKIALERTRFFVELGETPYSVRMYDCIRNLIN